MIASPSPEYRRCPATGRWVVLAPERALRPIELPHGEPHRRNGIPYGICPFCPGQEQDTPGEVYADRTPGTTPGGPGWRLRVVPNKFPAVRLLSAAGPSAAPGDRFFEAVPGFGSHEVVIACPDHETNPAALSGEQFARLLVAFRERLLAHARDPGYAYATVFQNVGAEAGASLAHLHAQIVATPIVPDAVREELAEANQFYHRERRCVYCEMIRREREAGVRVVAETERFVAVCPFAPRFGHEFWLLPVSHDSRYEAATDDELGELAGLMRRVLRALDAAVTQPAYNLYLHGGPLRAGNLPYYHWHIEVAPKTARPAGFEWGSGCFINAVLPERAAAELRAALGPGTQ